MTNFERIKEMDVVTMARFLNSPPACYEHCKELKAGCAQDCKHDDGIDVLKEWLEAE